VYYSETVTIFLPEVCQLSFKEIPASEQEKYLLEYHKIFYSQSHQQPKTIAQLVWPHNRTVKDTGPYCCYHEYLYAQTGLLRQAIFRHHSTSEPDGTAILALLALQKSHQLIYAFACL
jgi:hypothetical protein